MTESILCDKSARYLDEERSWGEISIIDCFDVKCKFKEGWP